MKVLMIAFPSGVQWRLMFNGPIPLADIDGVGRSVLTDDFGQKVTFTPSADISILEQDTEELDKLEVEMMVRQAKNQAAAQSQFQADPRNMIMRPPGMMS
jgi:hypothetical protein